MRENTKKLFLYPFLMQEGISCIIMIPTALYLGYNVLEGIKNHIIEAIILVLGIIVVCIPIGACVKYILVRPGIEIMEKDKVNPEEIQRAVQSTSILPLMEAIFVFIRWAGIGWVGLFVPFYLKGYISFCDLFFGGNIAGMTGLSCAVLFYLASENSLIPFYTKCNMKGVLDGGTRFFKVSLSLKLLATILLIAMPPIGNFLGVIYISIYKKVDLVSLQFGFILIIAQTIITTFINSSLLIKSLSLSVRRMSLMFEDVARGQGDLTKRLHVSGLDEVGNLAFWFNEFIGDLESLISQVKNTSLELHRAIEDVSSGSHELSQATQEQAASVEEISASIEEMNSTVKNNSDLIREGQDTSNVITKLIEQSKNVFAELMRATQEISKDSNKIADIVVTVNEVAFHTNLLALNASVEAARAGEHGKGFAVVAGEVRSLAQRSAQAAREIKSLIEATVDRIKNGDEMMNKTSQSMEELMSRMEFFFKMMNVIGTASREEAVNISELTNAITQIDRTTQHNSSTVEELASVLDSLKNEATVLAENVNKFKISYQEVRSASHDRQ